jgi:hypothetical protein
MTDKWNDWLIKWWQMKQLVNKMTHKWNDWLLKRLDNKLASWWNDDMKQQVDEMTGWLNACLI